MGHDISGYNKAGKEIAYARFSMGNMSASILYDLLDAKEFYAGVSGSGDDSTFSFERIEKALSNYNQLFKDNYSSQPNIEQLPWDQRQILIFIQNCLETAKIEGSVRIAFS